MRRKYKIAPLDLTERLVWPIMWAEVREVTGDGDLSPEQVLSACNAVLERRRRALTEAAQPRSTRRPHP